MCIVGKSGKEEIIPALDYTHECDDKGSQKAWREIENSSKGSVQYSDQDNLEKLWKMYEESPEYKVLDDIQAGKN